MKKISCPGSFLFMVNWFAVVAPSVGRFRRDETCEESWISSSEKILNGKGGEKALEHPCV